LAWAGRHGGFVTAERPDDVAAAHRWAVEQRVPIFVLGGGSNLVIADEGFDGLVLHIGIRGLELSASDEVTRVIAGAGESWDRLVSAVVERGLAGVRMPLRDSWHSRRYTHSERRRLRPGRVGDDRTRRGLRYDREKYANAASSECGFAYRMSRFKGEDAGRFIVCEVAFCLRHGRPTTSYADVSAYFVA
jgi:UDP-N-acetylmuramate dehydrogenase